MADHTQPAARHAVGRPGAAHPSATCSSAARPPRPQTTPVRVAHEVGRLDLAALGIDTGADGLRETPHRMARAYAELFSPRGRTRRSRW